MLNACVIADDHKHFFWHILLFLAHTLQVEWLLREWQCSLQQGRRRIESRTRMWLGSSLSGPSNFRRCSPSTHCNSLCAQTKRMHTKENVVLIFPLFFFGWRRIVNFEKHACINNSLKVLEDFTRRTEKWLDPRKHTTPHKNQTLELLGLASHATIQLITQLITCIVPWAMVSWKADTNTTKAKAVSAHIILSKGARGREDERFGLHAKELVVEKHCAKFEWAPWITKLLLVPLTTSLTPHHAHALQGSANQIV